MSISLKFKIHQAINSKKKDTNNMAFAIISKDSFMYIKYDQSVRSVTISMIKGTSIAWLFSVSFKKNL